MSPHDPEHVHGEHCDHAAFENLEAVCDGGVLTVRIKRPSKMNALSRDTLLELHDVISEAQEDDDVGAVVVTGADTGKKPSFVAGADIAEMATMNVRELREHARLGQEVLLGLERSTKPTIAAINGFAFGGGLELAMACHIRYASRDATMGQPEINLALIPGFAGTQRLARLVGRGRALELLLAGDPIGAEEAYRIGLVNRVFEADALMPAATELAKKLASKAPLARAAILEATVRGGSLGFEDAQAVEADLFGMMAATADTKEGLKAFLEKRKAEWKGQ
ncbi:MAG TPA: enoyl-CoA hydratase-related protein [Planctomycetota bacterium]|nr:enoyl-CoA hydratase-related protein [Planctomycetota bacterium]